MNAKRTQGGFHIGSVGRDVKMQAGGDIVAGDKIVHKINQALKSDEAKGEIDRQLSELVEGLQALREEVAKDSEVASSEREALAHELAESLTKLEALRGATARTPAGKAERDFAEQVESGLERAGTLLERVQAVGSKSAALASKIADIVSASGATLANLLRLFGGL